MNRPAILTVTIIIFTTLISLNSVARPNTQSKGATVVPIYSELVDYHEVSQQLSLIGKLQSVQHVSIATEVTGKVSSINVNANQQVKEGQVLFKLDDKKAQATLLEAKAFLVDEQRKLSEHERLVKSNTVTQSALDAQMVQVDIGKARLSARQTELNDHYVKAPFAGTIGLIDFSRGQMVSLGSELMTLDDLSIMQLDLQVPEQYLSQLSIGMQVAATNRAWPNSLFNGEIVAIDSRINEDTLNLRIRVQFDNKEGRLKPGMMMSANIAFAAINEPIIPVQAIEYAGTKRFVYRVTSDNKVQRTEVILGGRIKDNVLIESGIEVGERIVVQGLVNMSDGLTIKDLSVLDTKEAK
ncbi:efflux transporter periplasmic adaptor subunit [Psychromonas sp. psych-6C06]|nr:efflux transporter periplasmic adaptor subunit [Psychromonas sp. psych-6C06]